MDKTLISSGPNPLNPRVHSPSPSIAQAHSNSGPLPPNQEPIYFVTEPSDNPPSPKYKPSPQHQTETQPLIIEEINPNIPKTITNFSSATPLIITSSPLPYPDKALAFVFRNLAIKCKPEEELADGKQSKLLCLCGPDSSPPLSNPITKSSTKRTIKPNPSRIKKSPRKGGLSSTTHLLDESNSCMFDVPMQMLDVELPLIPGKMVTNLKLDGCVAGPEQPPPQLFS
ncbi:hypothetical protein RHMOL_Rhmol09G0145500 [Rhododendron molle]|uniref:Uncharacterized protein n=1 Tax=Rhododendron molle TaxID=49168 RepID=A0ACC0MF69_RHOML|nr:hypothetical protein RHMOL_Rhmol09G0145500 [Rhododendron molle]